MTNPQQSDEEKDQPGDKPGVRVRRRQVADAKKDQGMYRDEMEYAGTGNVSTQLHVKRTKENLRRLLAALAQKKGK